MGLVGYLRTSKLYKNHSKASPRSFLIFFIFYKPLAICKNAANLGDRTMGFFLRENRSQFPEEICPPDWLHSHGVQGVYIVNFEPPKLFRISFKEFPFPSGADNNNNNNNTVIKYIDPLHVCGNAANLEDRTIRFFLQKRNFLLFCPPDWLHSHDVQGVYSLDFDIDM